MKTARGAPVGVVELQPQAIRALLRLEPHPTCGFVAETCRSGDRVQVSGLPRVEGFRHVGSAPYFLVTPDDRIKLHRIRNDQLNHNDLGAPLEVLLHHGDGTRRSAPWGGPASEDAAAARRPRRHLPHVRLPQGGVSRR